MDITAAQLIDVLKRLPPVESHASPFIEIRVRESLTHFDATAEILATRVRKFLRFWKRATDKGEVWVLDLDNYR